MTSHLSKTATDLTEDRAAIAGYADSQAREDGQVSEARNTALLDAIDRIAACCSRRDGTSAKQAGKGQPKVRIRSSRRA